MQPNRIEYGTLKQKLAGDVNYASAHLHSLDDCPDLVMARHFRLHHPLPLVLEAIQSLKPDLTSIHQSIANFEAGLKAEILRADRLRLRLRADLDRNRDQKRALEEKFTQFQSQQKALQDQSLDVNKQKEEAESQIAQLRDQKQKFEQEKTQLLTTKESLYKEISRASEDQTKFERQRRELPVRKRNLDNQLTQTDVDMTYWGRELRSLQYKKDDSASELRQARSQRQDVDNELSQLQKQIRELQDRLADVRRQIEGMNWQLIHSTDQKEQLDRLKREEEKLKRDLQPLSNKENELKRKLDPLQKRENRLKAEFEAISKQENDLDEKLKQLREQKRALEAERDALPEQGYSLKQQLDEVKKQLGRLRQQHDQAKKQETRLEAELTRIAKENIEWVVQLDRFSKEEEVVNNKLDQLEQETDDLKGQLTEIEQLEKTYSFTTRLIQELNLLVKEALFKGTPADHFDFDHQLQYLNTIINNIEQIRRTLTQLSKEIDNGPRKGLVLHAELRPISATLKELAKTPLTNDVKLVVKQLAEFDAALRKASDRATKLSLEQAYDRIIHLNDTGQFSRVLPRLIQGHKIISEVHISATQKQFLYRYIRLCALALAIEALATNSAQSPLKRTGRTMLRWIKLGPPSLSDSCLDLYVQLVFWQAGQK